MRCALFCFSCDPSCLQFPGVLPIRSHNIVTPTTLARFSNQTKSYILEVRYFVVEPRKDRHFVNDDGICIKHDVNDVQMTRIYSYSGSIKRTFGCWETCDSKLSEFILRPRRPHIYAKRNHNKSYSKPHFYTRDYY